MFNEPLILINDVELSVGESMTVRVAIESLASSLHENGLGEDAHGKAMTAGYLKNIDSIRAKIRGAK